MFSPRGHNPQEPRLPSPKQQKPMTPEEFKKWLLSFDRIGHGRISRDELRNAIRSCGVWFSGWQAHRAMKMADINHNGVIDDDDEIDILLDYARSFFKLNITVY